MRVTKVIREYVEEEVSKKFDAKIHEIYAESDAKYKEFAADVEKMRLEWDKAVDSVAAAYGLKWNGYCSSKVNISTHGFSRHTDEEDRAARDLQDKKKRAIQEILLNLELGETTKATLRDAIDSIEA